MAAVCAYRVIPSVGLLIVVDDGSTDDAGRAARATGAIAVRHSVERGRASIIGTGVKVAAMYDRPDGPLRHTLLLFPNLDDSAIEATAFIEAVFVRQVDMAAAVPVTGREYSGYGPSVACCLIRRKTGWNYHHPLNYQCCLTREAIDTAMPFSGRYMPEASTTINALRTGFSIIEAPYNFAHSGADRSLGSFSHPARMPDAVRVTVNQLFYSDACSRHRTDHEQGVSVSHPAPTSARDGAEVSDPPDVRCTRVVG